MRLRKVQCKSVLSSVGQGCPNELLVHSITKCWWSSRLVECLMRTWQTTPQGEQGFVLSSFLVLMSSLKVGGYLASVVFEGFSSCSLVVWDDQWGVSPVRRGALMIGNGRGEGTVIECSLNQIYDNQLWHRQFNRFWARVFSTPCICAINLYLHYKILFPPLAMSWQGMRVSTKKQATWTTLSYCIWKAVSRVIVTRVAGFTLGAQQFMHKCHRSPPSIASPPLLASSSDPALHLLTMSWIVFTPRWRSLIPRMRDGGHHAQSRMGWCEFVLMAHSTVAQQKQVITSPFFF